MPNARLARTFRSGLTFAAGGAAGILIGALLGLGCPKSGQLERAERMTESAEQAIERALRAIERIEDLDDGG